MLVELAASDLLLVGLHHAGEKRLLVAARLLDPLEHVPIRLLRSIQLLGELQRGDALARHADLVHHEQATPAFGAESSVRPATRLEEPDGFVLVADPAQKIQLSHCRVVRHSQSSPASSCLFLGDSHGRCQGFCSFILVIPVTYTEKM